MIICKRLILVLLFSFLLLSLYGNGPYQVEQLLSPDNDRLIYKRCTYWNEIIEDTYLLINNYQNPGRYIGDSSCSFWDEQNLIRWYQEYGFADFSEEMVLESVVFKMMQTNAIGNNQDFTYSSFGFNNDEPIKISIVDFDYSNLGGSFYPEEFRFIGILTDEIGVEWREVDITEAYLKARDLYQEESFKIMLYFDVDCDYDNQSDAIGFCTTQWTDNEPRLVFNFVDPTSNEDNECEAVDFSFNCFPNPVTNNFSVKSGENQYIETVDVFNIKGQKVYSKNIANSKSNETEIKLSQNLSSGIYLVKSRISNGKAYENVTKKIIIK